MSSSAQFYLSIALQFEFGSDTVQANERQAIQFYSLAAKRGSILGKVLLGVGFEHGRGGLPVDLKKAEALYSEAVREGDGYAQACLGMLLELRKEGALKSDKIRAIVLYQESAIQGNPLGQLYLGLIYETGEVFGKDINQAQDLFVQSLRQEDRVAELIFKLQHRYLSRTFPLSETDMLWERELECSR